MASRVSLQPLAPEAPSRDLELMLYRFARAGYFDIACGPSKVFYLEWVVMWLLAIGGGLAAWYGQSHNLQIPLFAGVVVLALFGVGAIVFYPQQWIETRRSVVLTLDGVFMPGRKPLYWSDTRQIGLARYRRRTYVAVETSSSGFHRMLGDQVAGMLARDTRDLMGPTLRDITTTTEMSRELTGAISGTETWVTIPSRTRMGPDQVARLLMLVRERVTGMIPDPPAPDLPTT